MKRREFAKAMGAVAAGLAAGSVLRADEKAADKAPKHTCKPQRVQGPGRLQVGRQRLRGQELLQGQGRLRLGRGQARLQGRQLLQGHGRLQVGRQRLRRQELLQGQGRLRGSPEALGPS